MITVNLYYKGINGNARAFADEMESSGIADAIRAEKGNLRYEYFQPISKVKDFKPYGDDLFEEYLSGIDAFCENVVMTSEHINSNLYKEFLNQNVYSCCLFELRAFDKTFGVLRADMTSVDTGRIWQNDDLVLLETLAHTIALISYSSKE